jgi:hypothetical protein
VPMNEMLTEALRTTKIEELAILDFRSWPKVTAIFLRPRDSNCCMPCEFLRRCLGGLVLTGKTVDLKSILGEIGNSLRGELISLFYWRILPLLISLESRGFPHFSL